MSNKKLSILIATIEERFDSFKKLYDILESQLTDEVEILFLRDNKEMNIGEKRNKLISMSEADYICFIDDDDLISNNYISKLLEGIQTQPDNISLTGIVRFLNGKFDGIFIHSIRYKELFNDEQVYYRPPNHLNVIKRSIAKQFPFPSIDFGEDTEYCIMLRDSGLLKNEYRIDEPLYIYNYRDNILGNRI